MTEFYFRGARGMQFGIWNVNAKKFQFGICEDTPMLAVARLYQKIGVPYSYTGNKYCPNCGAKMDGGAEDGC